jgi:hypothetical protein
MSYSEFEHQQYWGIKNNKIGTMQGISEYQYPNASCGWGIIGSLLGAWDRRKGASVACRIDKYPGFEFIYLIRMDGYLQKLIKSELGKN